MEKHSIGLEMRAVNNLVMRYFENCPGKKAVDSVSGTNGWIVGYISRNEGRDIFQRDLEKEFSITRSTASKVVNLMVQKGLIERHPVPEDARLKKLVLTDKALRLVHIMQSDAAGLEETIGRGFTPQELETFFGFMERMKENLGG